MSSVPTTELYFECHITIEPVKDDIELNLARTLAKSRGFRLADLLMVKPRQATEERSNRDTFMTGRDVCYKTLHQNMLDLVDDLRIAGFSVWRYKIENTLLDVRCK